MNKGYGAPMMPTRIGGTVPTNPCNMSIASVRFEVLGMRQLRRTSPTRLTKKKATPSMRNLQRHRSQRNALRIA